MRTRATGVLAAGAVLAGLVLVTGARGTAGAAPEATREAHEKQMAAWHGRSAAALERALGPPDERREAVNGNLLLAYRRILSPGDAGSWCIIVFEIDEAGDVLDHLSMGPGCRALPENDASG